MPEGTDEGAWADAAASPAHNLGPLCPPFRFEGSNGGEWDVADSRRCFVAAVPAWRMLAFCSNDADKLNCAGSRSKAGNAFSRWQMRSEEFDPVIPMTETGEQFAGIVIVITYYSLLLLGALEKQREQLTASLEEAKQELNLGKSFVSSSFLFFVVNLRGVCVRSLDDFLFLRVFIQRLCLVYETHHTCFLETSYQHFFHIIGFVGGQVGM